jgi:hypothetical protein
MIAPDKIIYPRKALTPAGLILLKADVCSTERCWLIDRPLTADGYARITIPGRGQLLAHRVAYEALIGPIPPKHDVDHRCENRNCCNPFHLEAVSHKENAMRSSSFPKPNRQKTHCPKGHPYTDANTIRVGNRRVCRTCNQERCSQRRSKKRESGAPARVCQGTAGPALSNHNDGA